MASTVLPPPPDEPMEPIEMPELDELTPTWNALLQTRIKTVRPGAKHGQ